MKPSDFSSVISQNPHREVKFRECQRANCRERHLIVEKSNLLTFNHDIIVNWAQSFLEWQFVILIVQVHRKVISITEQTDNEVFTRF